MNKKLFVIIFVVSVAINLGAVVTLAYYWLTERGPQEWDRMPPPLMAREPNWEGSPLKHMLNLTDEQIVKMNAKQEEMRSKMHSLADELFMKRKELMALLTETELDNAKADTLIKEIAALQVRLELQIFKHFSELKKILTPEQYERLFTLFDRQFMPLGLGMIPLDKGKKIKGSHKKWGH